MKILIITNRDNYDFKEVPHGFAALAHFSKVRGHEVVAIGKSNFKNFLKIYREFNPDIIVGGWVPGGFIPVFLRKIGIVKCPVINVWDDHYAKMMVGRPRFIVRFLEKFSAKHADAISTVSGDNAGIGYKMGKLVYLLDHGRIKEGEKSEINLLKLKTNKENVIAIYLGEQSKYKEVDKLINAVKDKRCDLFLFGETNKDFQKIAGKNVHFMGYLDNKKVHSVLIQADILINSSNMDFNFKVFDYIYAGKPILTYSGKPDYRFKHLETAYLTTDFEEGLKTLIDNKKLRVKLGKNVKKIKTHYWDEAMKRYIKVIEEVYSLNKKGKLKDKKGLVIVSDTIKKRTKGSIKELEKIWEREGITEHS